ncbi:MULTISPECIES: hypothetical protein [unclassified Phenylobacterium]|uniref:hypothetical protein n=1 Tax=unclassified Phenylobacterium TaxID=2640670 RepID=UPI00083AD8A5|nr:MULTISPECIES: hypothetical protein [unclassified Phenylobacterium]
MSMSISGIGNSFPVDRVKRHHEVGSALTDLAGALTPTPPETVQLQMVPQGALVRVDAQLLASAEMWSGDAADRARAARAYGLASMSEVGILTPTPPPEPMQEVSGLGFISGDVFTSGDPDALKSYVRDQVADARDAARRERDLSRELGTEVRLAFDPNLGQEVALTAGDAGFEAVRGARAMLADMRHDLQKMGLNPADFRDLLAV